MVPPIVALAKHLPVNNLKPNFDGILRPVPKPIFEGNCLQSMSIYQIAVEVAREFALIGKHCKIDGISVFTQSAFPVAESIVHVSVGCSPMFAITGSIHAG